MMQIASLGYYIKIILSLLPFLSVSDLTSDLRFLQ